MRFDAPDGDVASFICCDLGSFVGFLFSIVCGQYNLVSCCISVARMMQRIAPGFYIDSSLSDSKLPIGVCMFVCLHM